MNPKPKHPGTLAGPAFPGRKQEVPPRKSRLGTPGALSTPLSPAVSGQRTARLPAAPTPENEAVGTAPSLTQRAPRAPPSRRLPVSPGHPCPLTQAGHTPAARAGRLPPAAPPPQDGQILPNSAGHKAAATHVPEASMATAAPAPPSNGMAAALRHFPAAAPARPQPETKMATTALPGRPVARRPAVLSP